MLFMSCLPSLPKIWIGPIWNIMGLWEVRCQQRREKEISEKYGAINGLNSFPTDVEIM